MKRQWWIFTLGLTGLATTTTALNIFWRADSAVYDAGMPSRPAPADVVIIGIDDASLAEFGRWPWPRSRHAALLNTLRAAGTRAVALDLILTESDIGTANDDAALAQAMRAGPPTVLPSIVEMPSDEAPRERLPVPVLAQAAAGIGHVQLEVDRDGIARSVYLKEGLGVASRPQLVLALLQSLHPSDADLLLSAERNPDPRTQASTWVRDYRMEIPFLGPPGHFTSYSYRDVVRGQIPAAALRGKLVLVGMTAQGGGDAYPTPVSGNSRAMPGVEIHANVLQGLRDGTMIRRVNPWLASLLAAMVVSLACRALLQLSPRRSLATVGLLWATTLTACVACVRFFHWEWPCSATLASLTLAYPIWSWLRLEMTQRYLDSEIGLLALESAPLLTPRKAVAAPQRADALQRRVEALRQATMKVRDLRRLLADTVHGLPDATLVINIDDQVALANAAAAHLLGVRDEHSISSERWARFRQTLVAPRSDLGPDEVFEVFDEAAASNLLVRIVPLLTEASANDRLGTLISIVDITALRNAQREKEEYIRFLSHDLKSPASSLMGLAQLQRDPQRALPPEELANRLDALGQRTLDLVDGFISIAQAESLDPVVFSELDLRDALQDASDEVWAYAEARGIHLKVHHPDESLIVSGDRQLLARAVANLLNNAIKFSARESTVEVSTRCAWGVAIVSVIDEGLGVSPQMAANLFNRSSQPRLSRRGPAGTGLGLAFVRIVAEKHRGAIQNVARSAGAQFDLRLPTVRPLGHRAEVESLSALGDGAHHPHP